MQSHQAQSVSAAVLKTRDGACMALRSVAATGAVRGLLFELAVTQRYVNPEPANVEVVYTFPLPYGAVLLGMEVVLGEKVLHGAVVAKANAEEQYEEALEKGDMAIMLERAADGLYTVNLGNLMAGEEASIHLRYAQLLAFEQGQIRIAVPTVIAPRFGNAAAAGLTPHQVPEHHLLAAYPFSLRIVVTGAVAKGIIASPSHTIACQHDDDGVAVSLAQNGWLDRDVVLSISGLTGKSLTTVGRDGAGTVALASFCPPRNAQQAALPVALKILLDCSGSMSGDSIAGARRAMHEVLQQLTPEDQFSYSCFGDTVTHHTGTLIAAKPRAIRHAAQKVASTDATMGGTHMVAALASTYRLGARSAADILLITDGEVWDVDTLVADAVTAGQRIFTVGIGSAPADSLLRSLAVKTGGACECIGKHDNVAAAILRMFARMRQAPVSDLSVRWDVPTNWESPLAGPLFCEETIHVFAGFVASPPTAVTLAWHQTDDPEPRGIAAELGTQHAPGDTLARMAAAMRLNSVPPSARAALALEYQLVTESTNFLIVHQRADGEQAVQFPALRTQAQMMAAGWGGTGLSVRSPQDPFHARAPAVWRRESASEQILAMQKNGVDSYDIPAFLRKTCEDGTPARKKQTKIFPQRVALIAFLRASEVGTHREQNAGRQFPVSFAQIAGQIPSKVFDELLLLREDGYAEADVVIAFIAALAPLAAKEGLSRHIRRALTHVSAVAHNHPALRAQVGTMLDSLLQDWEMADVEVRTWPRFHLPWRKDFS